MPPRKLKVVKDRRSEPKICDRARYEPLFDEVYVQGSLQPAVEIGLTDHVVDMPEVMGKALTDMLKGAVEVNASKTANLVHPVVGFAYPPGIDLLSRLS